MPQIAVESECAPLEEENDVAIEDLGQSQDTTDTTAPLVQVYSQAMAIAEKGLVPLIGTGD